MREVVLDTETTGLSPEAGDRIVEIGCVVLENHIPTGEEFQRYLNPGRLVGAEAAEIHGLSDAFLSQQPLFGDVVEDFLSFIGMESLVIHNVSFDMGFLNEELRRLSRDPLPNKVVDTLEHARRVFPGQRNSLEALCRRLQIDMRSREKHGALIDARLLAQVYLRLCGGRQMGMGFSASLGAQGGDERPTASGVKLPSMGPLSSQERAAHAALVESLGVGALWRRYEG